MQLPALALCMLMASAVATFITVGQVDVCEEDVRLVAELKRRTNHDALVKSFHRRHKLPNIPQNIHNRVTTKHVPRENKARRNKTSDNRRKAHGFENKIGGNSNETLPKDFRRREGHIYGFGKAEWFPTVPTDRALMHKMVDLVEQSIYGAQYRIKEIEHIANKYSDRIEYRIAYIFKKLEEIERELEYIYGYIADNALGSSSPSRIFTFLIYYEYVMARQVDVTYICERLASIHTNQTTRASKQNKPDEDDYSNSSPGPNMTWPVS